MNHPRSSLLALALVTTTLVLSSCGSPGGWQSGGSDNSMEETNPGGKANQAHGEMSGMDHRPGNTASGMLMQNGEYSDERFIDAMVPHHQGAVEMARVALQNAEHQEITQLSKNIISTQQAEIEELKSIKEEEFGTSQVPKEMSPQQMRGMGVMMDPRELADKKPFDRAFIDAMIPHHRSAIEMARVASERSKNPRIRELAGNIINAQQAEIEQMKRWRKEWYPEG
jgi:uncharacterized protein (DUF305 family)